MDHSKGIARILIGVVILFFIFEVIILLVGPKQIKVHSIFKIDDPDLASGNFISWGIAPIGKNKFLVADNLNNRLLEFDDNGNFLNEWGKGGINGKKNEVFHEPSGIVSDDNGNAYVVDTWNSAITGYDETGKKIFHLDLTKYSGFFGPRGIGFDGQNLVIADTGGHRIALIGLDGVLKASWGQRGSEANNFNNLESVVADRKGNYFVADTENNRVKWLNANGQVIEIIKDLKNVRAVALDKEGRLYVASDADSGTIRVYSLKSKATWFSSKATLLGTLVDQNEYNSTLNCGKGMFITSNNILYFTARNSIFAYKLPANIS